MIGRISSLEKNICKHYLELSDDSTGKHKFYELELDLDSFLIIIRYGRIGTNGQSQKISFKTTEEAKKIIEKKLSEKLGKGYQPAEPGKAEKREPRYLKALRDVKILYRLISIDDEVLAEECYQFFKSSLHDEDVKEEFEDDFESLLHYCIVLGAEYSLLYKVDWKDTETIVSMFDAIIENLGCNFELNWPDKGSIEESSVSMLIGIANNQLKYHGLQVWSWDTDEDSYQGWISKIEDSQAMFKVANDLNLSISCSP